MYMYLLKEFSYLHRRGKKRKDAFSLDFWGGGGLGPLSLKQGKYGVMHESGGDTYVGYVILNLKHDDVTSCVLRLTYNM